MAVLPPVRSSNFPTGVAVDAAGNLYIADNGNSVVRRVSAATGVITTIAGNGALVFNGESGTAVGVAIDPTRIAIDSAGTIYITDQFNDRIRKLTVAVPAKMTIFSGDRTIRRAGNVIAGRGESRRCSRSPVGGVLVTFSVSSGTATLNPSTAITGGDGVATLPVLGSVVGALKIVAAAPGHSSVTFILTFHTGHRYDAFSAHHDWRSGGRGTKCSRPFKR